MEIGASFCFKRPGWLALQILTIELSQLTLYLLDIK